MVKSDKDIAAQRKIGERIKKLREAKKLSGAEVARRADVSKWHYSVIERGKTQPTTPTLGRIAKVLGVTTAVLLGEKPLPNGGEP
jgi:transcriptional regulator with XRE-family HTH domain